MAKDIPYEKLVELVFQLKAENEKLKKSDKMQTSKITGIEEVTAVDAAIKTGFKELSAMLEPLRSLRPPRTPLDRDAAAALHALHASLARPNYENLKSSGLDSFIAINSGKRGGKKS